VVNCDIFLDSNRASGKAVAESGLSDELSWQNALEDPPSWH